MERTVLHKFIFLFFLLSSIGQAKIIDTANILDAASFIDEDTWLLVDLDNTLFEAKQALGHARWFDDEVEQRVQIGMSRKEAIRDTYPMWIITQQICPVKPLEESFVPFLRTLQNRNIVVMGLTLRQPSIAKSTLDQVASLGFDFAKTAPSKDSFPISATHPSLYLQGILFVSDYNKKSDLFLSFLSLIQKRPKKVILIDDKRKNVEELEQVLPKIGIDYIGIHYTAINHAAPVYSRDLAKYQYKFLSKIMSNEAATLLMQHGLE